MNYGNILTTTWKTLWKEKVIIWFGMLMMVAPAVVGVLIGIGVSFSSPAKLERFIESGFGRMGLVIFFFVYFFFIASTFVLAGLSFSGTFKGILLAQTNTDSITFGDLWKASMPYLWRMLGVMFSVGFLLGLVYMLPLGLLVLAGALTAGIGFLCAVPFFILFIPVGLVGYLLLSLSMAALVVEDDGVFEAVQSAWRLLKTKFWPLVLMTLILYMIQFGVGMVIAVPINIVQFALIIPMETGNVDPETMFRYFGLFMAFVIPISSILQSFGLTYVNGAWTLAYLEASAPPTTSTETEDEIVEYDA